MKTKILISAWMLLTAKTFAATALHHYTFDSPDVTDSIGTANGTLIGGATIASGRLNLDGSTGYVQFNQHIVPTPDSFSIAFFAQEISPQPSYTEIVSQGVSGGLGFYVGYDQSHNFRIGDGWQNTGLPFPRDGRLHHYAVTKGDDTRLYVDGSLVATHGPIGLTSGGDDTRLGRQYDFYAEFFHGNVDELWVFSGTLTAGEVAGLAAVANLNGSDDFNDNFKDGTRWGTDFAPSVGLLTETNGRLEFTTSGVPTGSALASRPWILNFGSYTQDWEFQIDVSVPQLALAPPQFLDFGLGVVPGTSLSVLATNRFTVDLAQNGNTSRHEFECHLAVGGGFTGDLADKETTSANVAVRIAFDANAKVLSAYYDEDGPNCGYTWTLLGSTNVPSGWNMNSSSVFGIAAFGHAVSVSVASGDNVFGDNFCASSGATSRLGITPGDGRVVISWSTNGPACHLESASTLTPPICWHVATNTPGIVGTNFNVTNAISSGSGFYRLSR